MELNEAQIIEQCQKGRLELFATLYDAYAKKIYKFIYFKTMHRETAEDLTSSTFLKAFENIGRFDTARGPFSAWLYRIARNSVIDHYRTKKTSYNIEDCWGLSDSRDFVSDFANREALERVKAHLLTLKPVQRELVTLRVWGGMSYREIAEVTGASEASLKMSMSRIVNKIKNEEIITLLMVCHFFKNI